MKYLLLCFIIVYFNSCRKDDYSKANFGYTRTFGLEQEDNAQKVLLIDNELYIFGTSQTYGKDNFYLLKTDVLGNTIAEYKYETQNNDNGSNILLSSDGNLLLVGTTQNSTSSDILVKKVDLNGIEIWSIIIGGIANESVSGLIETDNGEICLAGTTKSNGNGNGNNDIYLVWLTQNGDIVREKTYGGTQSDGSTAILTSNSDLVVLGYTNSWGAGGQDYLLMKINSVGDSIWTKTYGGSGYEESQGIVKTANDGYIINGHSNSIDFNHNMYTVAVNKNGDLLWDKNYGGSLHDGGQAILKTENGNYLLIGRSKSFGNGSRNIYMVTVTENGFTTEEKSILTDSDDWINDVINFENYYYMVGHTLKLEQSDTDLLLMKLKK